MASPSDSPPTISPPSPASPSPLSVSPPPEVSLPPASQPNADPPTSSSPPLPVSGSPPPAFPSPPATTPIPSSPPPTSPPPAASPPPIISPPPPPEAPPQAPPPPLVSPPAPLTAPPPSSPPLPPLPAPSPPIVLPSPPVGSPPPPVTPPTPTPTKPSAPPPTPTASSPPASPVPPSISPPPSSSPPHATPTPSSPTVFPSPPAHLPPPPVASPPPSVPSPSKPAPPTPANDSPSPPPVVGSPPSPDSQPPSVPSLSPPSRNDSQSVPSVSPPEKSPSVPPSSPRSPPSNPTHSTPPVTSPTRNGSLPAVPITSVPPGDPNVPRSPNSAPDTALPREINSSGAGGIKTGTAVGIAVIISFVVLGLAGTVLWSVMKRKKKAGVYAGGLVRPSPFNSSHISEFSDPRSPTPLVKNSSGSQGLQYSPSDPGLGHSKAWFTYEELSEVTNGFSSQNILGEGGFGCVYKGCLPDGREVAVKQLKVDGGQGEREFMAEVEIISRVHHRHLVSLVGYCISENQRLLIYDYVPNNTLHYHLHGEGRPVMDWTTRLKVALGAARGLAYLHEDCHPRIIHRDIKSSNILLDNNFEAQVSDFGLAKLAMDACTHVTTRVVGTFGYMAPEYASSGKLTSKSDVFSFGVVLLELVTGRKPVDPSQPLGDESLVEWARPLMTRALEMGEFDDLPDPRLDKNYNRSEMFRMIEIAAACVRHSAAMRPHMGQVARSLDCLGDSIDLHNGVKPGQSEVFNSAQHSAEIRLFQRMAFGSQDYSSDFSQTTTTSWSRRDT